MRTRRLHHRRSFSDHAPATAKCGLKAVDKLQERILTKLDKRLRKRGAEHLVEIAKRFAE